MLNISKLFALAVLAITAAVAIPATTVTEAQEVDPASYLVSHEAMMHWLATTDAELTFIGEPINPLAPRDAENTMITFCSDRTQNVCGGPCNVYNGGAKCLATPNTNCLAATKNVGFCSGKNCDKACNQLSTCGVRLDNGFCFTPGTNSIIVSPA